MISNYRRIGLASGHGVAAAHRRPDRAGGGELAATRLGRCRGRHGLRHLGRAAVDTPLRAVGLSFARFEILRLLAFSREGRLPMGIVGRRLQVHPASITSAVDRLERDGLVRRIRSEGDRRRVIVELTVEGRRLCEDVTLELNRCFASIDLSRDDLDTVVDVLGRLRAGNGDFDEP